MMIHVLYWGLQQPLWVGDTALTPDETQSPPHHQSTSGLCTARPFPGAGRCASPLMIIDSHTHIFPEGWAARRTALAAREPLFAEMYSDPRARMATAADLLRSMDAHGIDQAVICGFGWDDPALCRAHNDALLEAAAAAGDRLLPFITLSLRDLAAAAREAERCRALGATGIGELRPEWQGLDLATEGDAAVLAALAGDAPLLIHATEAAGHRYPGKQGQRIDALYRFIERRPEVRVIAAHLGGGLPLYAHMPEVREVLSGMYVDTAAWPLLYRPAIFRAVADLIGAQRILFATDFPLRSQGRELSLLQQTPLTASEQRLVLGGNASRLFGLAQAG